MIQQMPEKELEKFEAGGYDAFSPEVMANLDRDPAFGAMVY